MIGIRLQPGPDAERGEGQVGSGEEVAPGVVRLPLGVVNAYLVGEAGGPWVLVDAGTEGKAQKIRAAAETYSPLKMLAARRPGGSSTLYRGVGRR